MAHKIKRHKRTKSRNKKPHNESRISKKKRKEKRPGITAWNQDSRFAGRSWSPTTPILDHTHSLPEQEPPWMEAPSAKKRIGPPWKQESSRLEITPHRETWRSGRTSLDPNSRSRCLPEAEIKSNCTPAIPNGLPQTDPTINRVRKPHQQTRQPWTKFQAAARSKNPQLIKKNSD